MLAGARDREGSRQRPGKADAGLGPQNQPDSLPRSDAVHGYAEGLGWGQVEWKRRGGETMGL